MIEERHNQKKTREPSRLGEVRKVTQAFNEGEWGSIARRRSRVGRSGGRFLAGLFMRKLYRCSAFHTNQSEGPALQLVPMSLGRKNDASDELDQPRPGPLESELIAVREPARVNAAGFFNKKK